MEKSFVSVALRTEVNNENALSQIVERRYQISVVEKLQLKVVKSLYELGRMSCRSKVPFSFNENDNVNRRVIHTNPSRIYKNVKCATLCQLARLISSSSIYLHTSIQTPISFSNCKQLLDSFVTSEQ